MTQKQIILQFLRQSGSQGLNSYDADYKLHIKQAPARIWDLKADGYTIITKNNPDKSVNWILLNNSPKVIEQPKPIEWYFVDGVAYQKQEPEQLSL